MTPYINKVNSEESKLEWLSLPGKLYKNFLNKPIMLVDDVMKIFDPARNSILDKGKVVRWVVYDKHNLCAGRIAAFCLDGTEKGQIGFFDCTNDETVAHLLLKTAEMWLKSERCKSIEGPVNFGEKDRFCGLLTLGFETKGLYLDNFNPPYYQSFFTSFGFIECDNIYSYHLEYAKFPLERLTKIVKWTQNKFCFDVRHFKWTEIEQFAKYLHSVYTATFIEQKRIALLSESDILGMLDQAKPFLYEKHCWFAFQDDMPAGFIMFIQEPSFFPSKASQATILKGFAFATLPSMRGKGLELVLCLALYQQLMNEEKVYNIMVSGINAKTNNLNKLISKFGGERTKVHQTFTYNIIL